MLLLYKLYCDDMWSLMAPALPSQTVMDGKHLSKHLSIQQARSASLASRLLPFKYKLLRNTIPSGMSCILGGLALFGG